MQEETLENISYQIENGKCSEEDGGNLCRKFSLHAKALTIATGNNEIQIQQYQ